MCDAASSGLGIHLSNSLSSRSQKRDQQKSAAGRSDAEQTLAYSLVMLYVHAVRALERHP